MKFIKYLLFFLLLSFICLPLVHTKAKDYAFDNSSIVTESKKIGTKELDGGITLHQYATKSYNDGLVENKRLTNYVVSFLDYANQSDVRIVNYTYGTITDFSGGRISSIATKYEREHPGWLVMGGINNDFFYIDSNSEVFNTCVQEGDAYKPYVWDAAGTGVLGWSDDGTLIEGVPTFSSCAYLELIGDEGVISSKEIAAINKEITSSGINLISYDKLSSKAADPSFDLTGCKVLKLKIRKHRFSKDGNENKDLIYVEGIVEEIKDDLGLETLVSDDVYLVCKDDSLDYLKIGDYIKCQYHLVGEWANVTNAAGYFAKVLDNGESRFYNSTGINYGDSSRTDYYVADETYINCKKNRTALGRRADGSTVFMTIEYEKSGNYGCSYYEVAEYLKQAGCVDGWLFDGGGSTSLITRVGTAVFKLEAGASDGNERSDGNGLFFVIKDPGIKPRIGYIDRFAATIALDSTDSPFRKDVSNIKIQVGNEVKDYIDKAVTFENLEEGTAYEAIISYDIINNDGTTSNRHMSLNFETSDYDKPVIQPVIKDKSSDAAIISFNVENKSKATLSNIKFKVSDTNKEFDIDSLDKELLIKDLESNHDYVLEVSYDAYDDVSKKTYHFTEEAKFTTLSNPKPLIISFKYNRNNGTNAIFDYELYNPHNTITRSYILYLGIDIDVTLNNGTIILEDIDLTIRDFTFVLHLESDGEEALSDAVHVDQVSELPYDEVITPVEEAKGCKCKKKSGALILSFVNIFILMALIFKKRG